MMLANNRESVAPIMGLVLDTQSHSRQGSEALDPKFKYPELQ